MNTGVFFKKNGHHSSQRFHVMTSSWMDTFGHRILTCGSRYFLNYLGEVTFYIIPSNCLHCHEVLEVTAYPGDGGSGFTTPDLHMTPEWGVQALGCVLGGVEDLVAQDLGSWWHPADFQGRGRRIKTHIVWRAQHWKENQVVVCS